MTLRPNVQLFSGRAALPLLVATLLALGVWSTGCTSPDAEGVLDDYADRTADRRGAADIGGGGGLVDFSGTYLLALEPTIAPGKVLLFETTVTANIEGDSPSVDFTFQPVKTDALTDGTPREDARTPVGDAIEVLGVPMTESGSFSADMGAVQVPGEANSVSGSPIDANLVLEGIVLTDMSFCGQVTGTISAPIQTDISGSTFGAVASDDVTTIGDDELLIECPAGTGGDEPVADAGDVGVDAPDASDAGDGDAGPPAPEGRCQDGLEGLHEVTFITETQRGQGADPTRIDLRLERTDDDFCYGGAIVSPTSGEDIGEVLSAIEIDGALTIETSGFTIPPGANPLLPDGGKADIQFRGMHWSPDGACGEMTMTLTEPFTLASEGEFAMLHENAPDTLSVEGPECSSITRSEPCGLEELAGEYKLLFITDVQRGQDAPPGEVKMVLEENALTCLAGQYESLTTEDTIVATLWFAEPELDDDGNPIEGQATFRFRNFGIPPGSNPLLPDGGTADQVLRSTQISDGFICGELEMVLFEPFDLSSDGDFAAGTLGENEPEDAGCPEDG